MVVLSGSAFWRYRTLCSRPQTLIPMPETLNPKTNFQESKSESESRVWCDRGARRGDCSPNAHCNLSGFVEQDRKSNVQRGSWGHEVWRSSEHLHLRMSSVTVFPLR